MAFQVASQVDSRTILDSSGAEKLLGNGDMLFLAADSPKPRRLQGTFVADKEVKKVVDFLKKQAASSPAPSREVAESDLADSITEKDKRPSAIDLEQFAQDAGQEDELFDEAKQLVIASGKASASLLQRRLRVGYARAARLLDLMEEAGIVGPADGAKPRDVFVAQEDTHGEDRSVEDTDDEM
jgi:S-DNA-T family DNA segregation ATPase FtsK/SpoIIIE